MTYIKNGVEYLSSDEAEVLRWVASLNADRRTTNNSQLASHTSMPRSRIAAITMTLKRRGYIRDAGKGAAYHWRLTDKGKRDPREETPR